MRAPNVLAGISAVVVGGLAVVVWASLALAWILRLFEIPSIFDKLLPDYSAFELFVAMMGLAVALRLIAWVVEGTQWVSRGRGSRH